MKLVTVVIGLTLGNFIWQWLFGRHEWLVALERSYFQLWAIATYYFLVK